MNIRDFYVPAIRAVMAEQGVEGAEAQPSPAVPQGASLADALQYTDWYVAQGSQEHYRFGRYYDAIKKAPLDPANKWAHIDVGCGAGVFSWAFLDWAAERGIERSCITLNGYDACPSMVQLAWMLWYRLRGATPDRPKFQYYHAIDAFIRDRKSVV